MPPALELRLIAWAVGVAVVLSAVWALLHHERTVGAQACELRQSQQRDADRKLIDQANARADAISGQLAASQAGRKVVYATITRTVDRIVDRPVYRDACLDADGLRLVNAARAGQAVDPISAVAAVPSASAASSGDGR